MADDLTDLFVDALNNMRTPTYAQERRTHTPIVYEKGPTKKSEVAKGVDPKSVIATHLSDADLTPTALTQYFGGLRVPPGVISIDPRRVANDVVNESDQPQSLGAILRHEAVHHLQSFANKGSDIVDPTKKDVPSLEPIKKLAQASGFEKNIGDLDLELPAYVAHQPWRIPGLTGELRNQFINEYSDYLSKYDPIAGKAYKLMAPELTATPRNAGVSAITMSTPVKATIANLDDSNNDQ